MADHSIEVLVVEDSVDLADLIRLMLEEYRGAPFRGPVFRVSHVQRLAQARDRMGQGGIHAILLDLDLPDSRGLDTFARARASADDIPIIVLSELADGPLTAAAMRQGAQDYLVKGDMSIDLVARSIRYAIGRKEAERTLLREQAERIHAEASLRARDEFLALAAHELKTPLTALKGFVQLMARRGTYDRDVINRIVTQVNRLDRISRDLLQIARIETG